MPYEAPLAVFDRLSDSFCITFRYGGRKWWVVEDVIDSSKTRRL